MQHFTPRVDLVFQRGFEKRNRLAASGIVQVIEQHIRFSLFSK
jgi:hypothetical protein